MSAEWAILLLLVVGALSLAYRYFRPYLVKEPKLAPHEHWPEILHWKEGDEFETDGWGFWRIRLIALNDSGGAYCSVNEGHTRRLALSGLVGHNMNYKDRRITEDMKNDVAYMELIKQFNIAYRELQERDKKNGVAA